MLRSPLFPAALLALCAGCSTPEPSPPPVAETVVTAPDAEAVLNHLSGSLAGVPAGADVELALIAVDERQRPDRLLSSLRLKGRGEPLPFVLKFNPEPFAQAHHVELRGRVTRNGELILRLPPRSIPRADSQALGTLQVVPAP